MHGCVHFTPGRLSFTISFVTDGFIVLLLQVNDEASDKVLQVEQEYNLKRQPIYKERNQVISQMPDFWHLVFRGHDTLRPIITAEDEEGLAHLVEVGKSFP